MKNHLALTDREYFDDKFSDLEEPLENLTKAVSGLTQELANSNKIEKEKTRLGFEQLDVVKNQLEFVKAQFDFTKEQSGTVVSIPILKFIIVVVALSVAGGRALDFWLGQVK